ncbi:helix-turn-helix domain-containing protein [Methylocapsa aurea]|uniref:helix-turn-helix domain-containing protein n=1 Tax=Methylocapsa aurea TaxID=663610 RepID=UPI0012EBD564|nr:helix-turn-helix domain-containing protein [Methylocapsa aurea]
MSFVQIIPNHLRPRREKVFGTGRPLPLDREAKVRITARARALMRRTEKGKHYGQITAKALAVLNALLWGFHNASSGLCFPSLEKIAEKAGCARSTVAEAIKALEEAGLLSWVNRITREREPILDLFGQWAMRWRVVRTSNAYQFHDLKGAGGGQSAGLMGGSSKSENPTGIANQDSSSSLISPPLPQLDPMTPLGEALLRLGKTIGALS